jgi:hypothetical protein
MGTGSVYKIEDGRLHILSNNHVCDGADKITAEFRVDGKNLGEFVARVDLCVEKNNVDIGLISLDQGKTLKDVPFVPIVDRPLRVGDEAYWVGCDAGNTQNGQIARIVHTQDDLFYMNPKAIGGDSGSSVVQFDENGNPEAVGLIAWVGGFEGKWVAMAQPSKVVLDVLAGGELPDIGDVPPTGLESERLIQGLLERLREMREERNRDFKLLRDRFSGLELDLAMQEQQTQLFRDRWKKHQDEQIDKQSEQDSIVEGLSGKFDNLKTMLKWSFYGLVGLLVAALFFKQGWATTVIIALITFVFRTGKLAYLLVHNAIVAKVKNPQTMSEALEGLQDGINEGIGRKEDAP